MGGGHDFLSEIGLFRRLGGTDLYASRVKSGSTIELGENVQLRSIVRDGDGEILRVCTNLATVNDSERLLNPPNGEPFLTAIHCGKV